ncbi:hypothetical protein BGW37DRAFT_520528 [Umbelopsis sp. PMI_123]|nr:hypothetical protein BGW37DRAFT_520528 [Umbelopsis sp. PMI_123]
MIGGGLYLGLSGWIIVLSVWTAVEDPSRGDAPDRVGDEERTADARPMIPPVAWWSSRSSTDIARGIVECPARQDQFLPVYRPCDIEESVKTSRYDRSSSASMFPC